MAAPVAITVVVVAFRQREALLESLRAVLSAGIQVADGIELIVVDNGDLAELVRTEVPEALVVDSGGNVGFAAAVNRGIELARGRWVALVNDDARIEPPALAAALAAGEAAAEIGSVATQVRFHSDPGRVNSAGISVNSVGAAGERLAGRPAAEAAQTVEVFGATGCFALYRHAMLDDVGALEPRFFAYLEDVDLAWRAQARGWRAVYEPGARALHHASASSAEGSELKYWLVGRNRVWLLARNASGRQLRRGLPLILLFDGAYVAFVAARDRTWAPLHGRIAGLRRWRTVRAARPEAEARRDVPLAPALSSWAQLVRMHLAYRRLGSGVARPADPR